MQSRVRFYGVVIFVLLAAWILCPLANHNAQAAEKGPKKFTNSLGMDFVYIPPGSFMMGSPETEMGRDKFEVLHKVTLTRGFYMQTTEVTQGQWEAAGMENNSRWTECGKDCPVEFINWNQTQEFIKKLNWKERNGTYRLPTEAEWEYCARAGSQEAFTSGPITTGECNVKEPALDEVGWYCYNSYSGTSPVAKKKPNAWGLYDMHGNVLEWCQNWWYDYPKHPEVDPTGPEKGEVRMSRGGSYKDPPNMCRSGLRNWNSTTILLSHGGFRLVWEPKR